MRDIDKLTLRQCPELMTTIIVIQTLREKLELEPIKFENLKLWYGYQLFEMRDKLVHLYQSMHYVNTFQN